MKPERGFYDANFTSVKKHPELLETLHEWEVIAFYGGIGARTVKFTPREYDKAEHQQEALVDYLRGCRFSDTEYGVFCDGKLVTDL